jgi:hypothetical protein
VIHFIQAKQNLLDINKSRFTELLNTGGWA